MKYSTAIIALVAAVSAQSIADLPTCGVSCLATGIASIGCTLTDFKCSCGKAEQLTAAVTPCVKSSCSAADEAKLKTVLGGICAAAGVPITLPAPSSAAPVKSSAAPVVSSAAPVKSSVAASAAYSASAISSAAPIYTPSAAETCAVVTVTTTITLGKPSSPAGPTAPYPTKPASSAAPYPTKPVGTGASYPPTVPKPSGTGAYSAHPPQFTGAASSMKVPAGVAGLMGLVAYLL